MDSSSINHSPRAMKKLQKAGSALAGIVAFILSIFADSSNDEDSAENSSGSLNYRTGERDDGTDPIGWYDHK
ncbi:MAG: hypothetical protein PsegKO_32860 [Pseudohongiellaceae bacterium]